MQDWVKGVYKNIWIEQFKKMSFLAYEKADIVTVLYERAKPCRLSWAAGGEDTGDAKRNPGRHL